MIIDLIKIAICCSTKDVIEFRDLNNLHKILHTHSVSPEPGRLCQVSASVLLFVCGTLEQPEVHRLDCSTIPPKEDSIIIFPAAVNVYDMCFVSREMNNGRFIIVTPEGPKGIHAYNVDTNKLEWKKEIEGMEKSGIVSDSHGHLFVCDDDNRCIHMLSVSDGQHLGCLIKTGEQGLGIPLWAVWSEGMLSLIVAHTKDWKMFISVIKVQ